MGIRLSLRKSKMRYERQEVSDRFYVEKLVEKEYNQYRVRLLYCLRGRREYGYQNICMGEY